MSSVPLLFVTVSILSCAVVVWGQVTCLDNYQKPVDWFVDVFGIVFFVCKYECGNEPGSVLPAKGRCSLLSVKFTRFGLNGTVQ